MYSLTYNDLAWQKIKSHKDAGQTWTDRNSVSQKKSLVHRSEQDFSKVEDTYMYMVTFISE